MSISACPSLSQPLNGDLRVTGLSINDKATISCDVGYVITGSAERSCTSSGWDGFAADCVPVCRFMTLTCLCNYWLFFGSAQYFTISQFTCRVVSSDSRLVNCLG